jgi:hypothetical protein
MRARGANARQRVKFESSYGIPPAGNWAELPFVSSRLGAEQGLIESDLLGQGREGYDPTLDVVNNDGDHVVPVDVRNFGYWLKLMLGDAARADVAAGGSIAFSGQPAVDSTVTINGTAFTFKASGATGNQVDIGVSLAATLTALATKLNASAVAGVAEATYGSANGALTILHDTVGTGGNAFTLAVSADSNGRVSGATLQGGGTAHTFTSGALALPSMSIELGKPEIPEFGVNYGVRGNTCRIGLSRRGLLNATLGLIAKGEIIHQVSQAGTPTTLTTERFAQATGEITQNGVTLANVVSAELAFSNNLDKVETIRPDSEIEDADPGMFTATGNLRVRAADRVLLDAATGRDPIDLTFGWTFERRSLLFTLPRVFLPRPKRPIEGPGGIEAEFAWQASGADGNAMTAVLTNDRASSY